MVPSRRPYFFLTLPTFHMHPEPPEHGARLIFTRCSENCEWGHGGMGGPGCLQASKAGVTRLTHASAGPPALLYREPHFTGTDGIVKRKGRARCFVRELPSLGTQETRHFGPLLPRRSVELHGPSLWVRLGRSTPRGGRAWRAGRERRRDESTIRPTRPAV